MVTNSMREKTKGVLASPKGVFIHPLVSCD